MDEESSIVVDEIALLGCKSSRAIHMVSPRNSLASDLPGGATAVRRDTTKRYAITTPLIAFKVADV